MTWSIGTNGEFTEDFNYGNPYNSTVGPLAPEFRYSSPEVTHSGTVTPTYDRRGFSLQQGLKGGILPKSPITGLVPVKADKGLHAGARSASGYYLLFPQIQWQDNQSLRLRVVITDDSVLSFYRSWDGHVDDIYTLVVNEKVYQTVSNTAGHGWTQTTVPLFAGTNDITWVLETLSYGPVLRGGFNDFAPPPDLPRYFRIADVAINVLELPGTAVASVIPIQVSYWDVTGAGTMTTTSHGSIVVKCSMMGQSSLNYDCIFGKANFVGLSSFITDQKTAIEVRASLAGNSTLTCEGSISYVHSSLDAGVVIDTYGELTVEIPIDTTQPIQALISPINTTVITMPTPTICLGIPIMPDYTDSQTSSFASAGTHTYNDAIDPASIHHVLPHNPTYRWVSADVTSAIDDPVYAWPERNGGPSWVSADPFAPTMHPHVHFNEADFSYTEYAQVVTFWWRYVQHMWNDLSTQTTPYTWTIVGIFAPPHEKQWQHILSSGYRTTAAPGTFTDDVNDGVSRDSVSEMGSLGDFFFGVYENGAVLRNNNNEKYVYVKGQIDWRPAIYTIVATTANTYLYARHRGHKWHKKSTLNNTSVNRFLLGRDTDSIGDDRASHMSLLEVCFNSGALSDQQVLDNEDYLMGVYHLEKYV